MTPYFKRVTIATATSYAGMAVIYLHPSTVNVVIGLFLMVVAVAYSYVTKPKRV